MLKNLVRKFRKFNAKNLLDKKLLKYLDFKNGFYIELGAYDGLNQSNTYYFEKYLDWTGILIEPSEKQFRKLKRNRSNKNFFYNCACDFQKAKLKLVDYGLITQNVDNIPNKTIEGQNLLNKQKTFITNTFRLDDLIIKSSVKKIDLLSLDVEGMELNVLQGIDFKKVYIKYILVETENFNKINDYLLNYKYKFLEKFSVHDYLFIQEE